MKTTFLFSMAMIFTFASLAQTTVKSKNDVQNQSTIQSNKNGTGVNSEGSASSTTQIQTNAVRRANDKAQAEARKKKQATVDAKQKTEAQAKATANKARQKALQDASASASAKSNSDAKVSSSNNEVSTNSAINGGATISTSGVKSSGHKVKEKGKAALVTTTDATLERGEKAVKETNHAVIKNEKKIKTASVTTIRPKPVTIKASTLVNGGIKLR